MESRLFFKKEWFYFGNDMNLPFYAGPVLPNYLWNPNEQKKFNRKRETKRLAFTKNKCFVKCLHPGCIKLHCRDPPCYNLETLSNKSIIFQMQRSMPKRSKCTQKAIVPDFTPNYLCSPKSLSHFSSLPLVYRQRMKFVVLIRRDIVRMITSGMNMFHIKDINNEIKKQLETLCNCNSKIFHDMNIHKYTKVELLHYFHSCWNGAWHHFLTNALSHVCLKAWLLSGFRRDQFSLVYTEDLLDNPEKILKRLKWFFGIHTDFDWDKQKCSHDSKHPVNSHKINASLDDYVISQLNELNSDRLKYIDSIM